MTDATNAAIQEAREIIQDLLTFDVETARDASSAGRARKFLRATSVTAAATPDDAAQALFEHEMRCRGVSASWDDVDADERAGWQASVDVVTTALGNHHALMPNDAVERRLREALTPYGETKAAYMGEFSWTDWLPDADGLEQGHERAVPWTTVKEIMQAIRTRAGVEKLDEEDCYAALATNAPEAAKPEGRALADTLREARAQLAYLDARCPTGTTPPTLAKIDAALSANALEAKP